MRIPALLCFTALLSAGSAHAGQPIFSEMPRWSDGWGVQAIQEFRHQRKVFSDGDERISTSHILNIDGVYTWKRWIRLTAKVPLVLNATREGQARQRGFGPVTLALPLKQYFNLDGRSGSWTFTPQLRAPSMSKIVRGNPWQHGWSFGYETETYRYLFGISMTIWGNFEDQSFEQDTHLHIGTNIHAFGSSGHLKLHAGVWSPGKRRPSVLEIGPVLYWRITDLWHFQTKWQYRRHKEPGTLDEHRVRLGLAMVF